MQTTQRHIKQLFYILWIIVLLLPVAGVVFPFFQTKGLNGWSEENKKPDINVSAVFDGSFQQNAEAFFNDKVFFHNEMVRFRNQIYYSCFNVAYNDKIIVGTDGVMYEKGYIYNALFGLYTHNDGHFLSKAEKLKSIQDTLTKMGKEFVYVAAPGKGTYYPENIPKYLLHVRPNIVPGQEYLRLFNRLGINYIDFDKWFQQLKRQKNYPLFSKNGIHYNKYGCYLVIDSLAKYFNQKIGGLPQIILDSIVTGNKAWENENDCFEGMNVLQNPPQQMLYYPYFHYQNDDSKKLKCIIIGDSYVWPLWLLDFNKKYFYDTQYWYYFNEVRFSEDDSTTPIDNIDVLQELKNTDVVIVMFTNATTLDLDNGFTDKVYNLFYGQQK